MLSSFSIRSLALRGLLTFCLPLLLACGPSSNAASWVTDLNTAKATAARENRLILVNFTGSDWCGWCIRLKSEVFDQAAFASYANQNLVLLEVDFPRGKPMSPEQADANQALAQRFHVQGYPTLIILNPQGVEIARTGYRPGGPSAFISQLHPLHSQVFGSAPGSSTAGAITQNAPKDKEEAPSGLFGWLRKAKGPAATGETLKLKGLSGVGANRLALINSESLKVGDDARIQLGDRCVRVHCVEIKDKSVLVKLDSLPEVKELELGK